LVRSNAISAARVGLSLNHPRDAEFGTAASNDSTLQNVLLREIAARGSIAKPVKLAD
jgi:hypothetical protein